MKKALVGVGALAVIAAVLVPLKVTNTAPFTTATLAQPTPGTYLTLPSTGGNLNCGPDQSANLTSYIASFSSGGTITFPHDACYTVDSTVQIDSTSNLTINGNGTIFNTPNLACGFVNSTLTATATNGTTTLTLPNVTGLDPGDKVTGAGISGHETLTAVNNSTKVVTMTPASPGPLTTSAYTFTCSDTLTPAIFVTNNTNIHINDLAAVGPWNGTNGQHGANYEGQVGIMLQCDVGATMSNDAAIGTQGDATSVQLPTYTTCLPHSINQNVNWAGLTVNYAGYTGMSMEAVVGMNVTRSSFNHITENALSDEVDEISTFFSSPNAPPQLVVISNVTFSNNTFANWNVDLIAFENGGVICNNGMPANCNTNPCPNNGGSGAAPPQCTYYGVQQYNFVFNANTITCPADSQMNSCNLAQVIGTYPGVCCTMAAGFFTNRVLDIGFTMLHNTVTGAAASVDGGSAHCWPGTGPPFSPACPTGSLMTFKNVAQLDIENNTIPVHVDSTFGSFLAVAEVIRSQVVTIKNNMFPGAFSTMNCNTDNGNTGTITVSGNAGPIVPGAC